MITLLSAILAWWVIAFANLNKMSNYALPPAGNVERSMWRTKRAHEPDAILETT